MWCTRKEGSYSSFDYRRRLTESNRFCREEEEDLLDVNQPFNPIVAITLIVIHLNLKYISVTRESHPLVQEMTMRKGVSDVSPIVGHWSSNSIQSQGFLTHHSRIGVSSVNENKWAEKMFFFCVYGCITNRWKLREVKHTKYQKCVWLLKRQNRKNDNDIQCRRIVLTHWSGACIRKEKRGNYLKIPLLWDYATNKMECSSARSTSARWNNKEFKFF